MSDHNDPIVTALHAATQQFCGSEQTAHNQQVTSQDLNSAARQRAMEHIMHLRHQVFSSTQPGSSEVPLQTTQTAPQIAPCGKDTASTAVEKHGQTGGAMTPSLRDHAPRDNSQASLNRPTNNIDPQYFPETGPAPPPPNTLGPQQSCGTLHTSNGSQGLSLSASPGSSRPANGFDYDNHSSTPKGHSQLLITTVQQPLLASNPVSGKNGAATSQRQNPPHLSSYSQQYDAIRQPGTPAQNAALHPATSVRKRKNVNRDSSSKMRIGVLENQIKAVYNQGNVYQNTMATSQRPLYPNTYQRNDTPPPVPPPGYYVVANPAAHPSPVQSAPIPPPGHYVAATPAYMQACTWVRDQDGVPIATFYFPPLEWLSDELIAKKRAELKKDPFPLAHRYQEYIHYFPLGKNQFANRYYLDLLANQFVEDSDMSLTARAVRFARKHYGNYWGIRDLELVCSEMERHEGREQKEIEAVEAAEKEKKKAYEAAEQEKKKAAERALVQAKTDWMARRGLAFQL
ncbi:hypothetical protein EJ04DRAFT_566958 [Polyplosphaeria fusca]|uniref:Uncharacterized protein n=1 Tax=Polyplosphaeria fusca TaxID=682080 RepID=A0A9P4UWR5_9PLEO|nr:hypothetical protein EJ04DRAFT_566958 [Polyplosphaeria fusca]